MACDEQICKAARHPQAMGVLRQPTIADLREAEHPLDHPDAVLDLGADGGLGAVLCPLHLFDNPACLRLASDHPVASQSVKEELERGQAQPVRVLLALRHQP